MAIIAQSSALAATRDCGTLKLCAADASNAVAAKMNRLYQKLMKKVVEETNERRLREAQAAWLDYRTKQCEFATAGFEGESIRPMLVADCYPLWRLTASSRSSWISIAGRVSSVGIK